MVWIPFAVIAALACMGAVADEMLAEAGVELARLPGLLGVEVLFAGEVIAV